VQDTILIEQQFNGPPDSGNGGYTCGRLAAFVDGPAAEVTLRLPPPLVQPLTVERMADGGAVLRNRDQIIAEARPTELDLTPPPPVDLAEARCAEKTSAFLDADRHPFPTCFVCGPRREPGDGLRIFAAPVGDDGVMAAAWTPQTTMRGHQGSIYSPLYWAALDCPTSGPVANDWRKPDFLPIVLARFAVRIDADVRVGEEHCIVSWPVEIDGRKRHAGAALYSAEGELKAIARALWIELKPDQAQPSPSG
jgi:hypothetical protein